MPRLRIDVFTIFPDLIESVTGTSIVGRARRRRILDIRAHDLRSMTSDPHRSVDDAPFGGGPGMVLAPEPVFGAVEAVAPPRPLFLLGPGGRRFTQAVAAELAGAGAFSLLCGRYEGVDQRVRDHLVDDELSIGDYVLAGGELAALVVIEAVARLVPGVVGNRGSLERESFVDGLLDHPHWTRPARFRDWAVPGVLLSGDHGRIARWRLGAAVARTLAERPDLIAARGGLRPAEREALRSFGDLPAAERERLLGLAERLAAPPEPDASPRGGAPGRPGGRPDDG